MKLLQRVDTYMFLFYYNMLSYSEYNHVINETETNNHCRLAVDNPAIYII